MFNIIKLNFLPNAVCWASPKDSHMALLACSDKESHNIHFFDVKSGQQEILYTISTVHSAPVRIMKYNPMCDVIVSADDIGKVEYWRPLEKGFVEFTDLHPKLWKYKSNTSLYTFQKVFEMNAFLKRESI